MQFIEQFECCSDYALEVLRRDKVWRFWIYLLMFFLFLGSLGADPDLFARISAGRLVEKYGSVVFADPFAVTDKKPIWVDHEWLSGVFFYQISQFGGDLLLFLFKSLIAVITVYILCRAQKIYSEKPGKIFIWTLLCVLNSTYIWASTARSQIFTYLFLSIILLGFVTYEKYNIKRFLLLQPLMMIPWANMHGGFVLGVGLQLVFFVGICFVRKKIDYFFLSIVLFTILATSVNPYGFVIYWSYILEAVTMPRPTIGEWAPIEIMSLKNFITHISILFIIAGLFIRRTSRTDLLKILLILAGTVWGYRHQRLIAICSFILAVYGISYFQSVIGFIEDKIPMQILRIQRAGIAFLILITPLIIYKNAQALFYSDNFRLSLEQYPVSACEWLRTNTAGGKVLIDFNNGSYVLWRLFPKFLVSLDGRYEEVYPESTVRSVSCALDVNCKDQKDELSRINPDFAIVNIKTVQSFADGWNIIYSDKDYGVFAKTAGKYSNNFESVYPLWKPLF